MRRKPGKEEAGWILNTPSVLSATNHGNQRKALLRSPLLSEMHLEIPPSHGLLPYKNLPTSKQLLNQTKSEQKDTDPGPQHQEQFFLNMHSPLFSILKFGLESMYVKNYTKFSSKMHGEPCYTPSSNAVVLSLPAL